jgi:hypothetical protein
VGNEAIRGGGKLLRNVDMEKKEMKGNRELSWIYCIFTIGFALFWF